MRRSWVLPLAFLLLAALPDAAHACPVCFDPREENRFAFLATTVFMSLVPLGMVGGVGLWLRKRARDLKGLPPEDRSDSTSD
ncbi:MAG TPA: hypothetical protein VLH75_05660 [Longimicrobiales bacterium]|nr:hypothetical protein [Longimicrobiales bacterium]